MIEYSPENLRLNKTEMWKKEKCIYCGRGYPETILNIEGIIHHHSPICCLDKKHATR